TSYAAVPTHADPSFPTRRSSDLMGRYHGLNSEVEVVNLQPTLSYKINDQVSVGGGLVISRIYGQLTSNSAVGPFDAKIEIEGDDIAYGYNLGVLVDFTERLSWGLTYHSKVKYSLEGDTKVSDMPAGVSEIGRAHV